MYRISTTPDGELLNADISMFFMVPARGFGIGTSVGFKLERIEILPLLGMTGKLDSQLLILNDTQSAENIATLTTILAPTQLQINEDPYVVG